MTGRALALTIALSCSSTACATETTPLPEDYASGTPSVVLRSPLDGACVEVSPGADAYIPITLQVRNVNLRVPGACADASGTYIGNCGHLALTVNGQPNNTSAGSVIDVLFGGAMASHYGELKLEVTLKDDAGKDWLMSTDYDGGRPDGGPNGPFSAGATISAKASCAGPVNADAGAGDGGDGG